MTDTMNNRRSVVENARRRFIYVHKDVFHPLLPRKAGSMDSLEKEFAGSGARRGYLPLHEFDAQPSLITGGTMKDYQVRLHAIVLSISFSCLSSYKAYPSLPGCITTVRPTQLISSLSFNADARRYELHTRR